MLGNMTRESGNVSYSGKLAFIPQEAWIRNGSVRDNVIFSLPYDKEKYKKVLAMTGLDSDIKQLKNGSKTLIGEKGIRNWFEDHSFRSGCGTLSVSIRQTSGPLPVKIWYSVCVTI